MPSLEEILETYPGAVPVTSEVVRQAISAAGAQPIFVVLDDDPTGTQSVSDLPVLTRWDVADFDWAFKTNAPAVYVMTNSRSLSPQDTAAPASRFLMASKISQ